MIAARGLAVVLLFASLHCIDGATSATTVVGVVSKNITLKCDIPHSSPPVVSWVDKVYNTGREPQPIFSSDSGMDDSHANRQNLSVTTSDFSLTISDLKLERGAGKYICRSLVDGVTTERVYNLVVRGMPECRGDSQLIAGDSTTMVCEIQMAGTFASALTWSRDGKLVVPTKDESDIGISLLSVSVDSVGPDDDQAVYKCDMTVAGVVEDSCSITLDVEYGARDVKFSPPKSSLSVGEELRCTARGNPPPEITLGPPTLVEKMETRSGDGWRSLVVPKDWVGRTLTVECSATNSVDEVLSSPSTSVIFNVTGRSTSNQCSRKRAQ